MMYQDTPARRTITRAVRWPKWLAFYGPKFTKESVRWDDMMLAGGPGLHVDCDSPIDGTTGYRGGETTQRVYSPFPVGKVFMCGGRRLLVLHTGFIVQGGRFFWKVVVEPWVRGKDVRTES